MVDRSDSAKWEQAIDKLIERTESGEINWHEEGLPLRPLMQGFVGPQYVADVEGKRIAVYEYAYPTESEDFGKYTDSAIRVEFVDFAGNCIWGWPVSSGRRELLDAVHYQATGAQGFLTALLAK